ncbi:MAG: tetraacyldisaccharide 4'-kinase, partial [Lentisphaerae bacterium]
MNLQQFLDNAETYMIDVILKRRRSKLHTCLRAFLYLCSRLYYRVIKLRNALYAHRILKDHTPGCLVISIGNITVGGTGKTPVVEIFARILSERNRKVAILSRGYKSKGPSLFQRLMKVIFLSPDRSKPRVVSNGENVLLSSLQAGDEPYMLARNLPGVIVLVDKDRVKAAQYAIQKFGCDTIIMDDGFQYLSLKPRHNILLIDATNAFSNHHLLPLGFLREPIENIRRADYIFLTKSNGHPGLRHLKRFIKKHNPAAEIIECHHKPQYLKEIRTGSQYPLSYLDGKRVAS